MKKQDHCY